MAPTISGKKIFFDWWSMFWINVRLFSPSNDINVCISSRNTVGPDMLIPAQQKLTCYYQITALLNMVHNKNILSLVILELFCPTDRGHREGLLNCAATDGLGSTTKTKQCTFVWHICLIKCPVIAGMNT